MTVRIGRSELELGPEIARGGQGRIRRVLNRTGDRDRPMVYKEYLPNVIGDLDERALDALGEVPHDHAADADWFARSTAWPQMLVEDHGRVMGFLMQSIPDEFHFEFFTSPVEREAKLGEYAFLLNRDMYIRDSGLVVTDKDRLLLLADVAAALGRLHRMGVAVGDLSPKNLLFAADRSHRTFFIDCDAMSVDGASALEQRHTPDWKLPHDGEARGTAASDNYKFGLLAIRLFARDQSSHDPTALAAVSSLLSELARRSQDSDPAGRPRASDWIEALQEGARQADLPRPQPPAPAFVQGQSQIQTQYPAQPYTPAQPHPRPQRNNAGIALACVIAVVVLVAVGLGLHVGRGLHLGTSPSDQPVPPGSTNTAQSPLAASSSPPPPSSIGVVTLDGSLVDDSRAQQVATMFNTYFTAISDKDYTAALNLFDPSGTIDPNDPQQAQSFRDGVSTSSDSDVALTGLSPSGPGPATSAEITFQSKQAVGKGPGDDPNQTCTDWTLTYTLTYTGDSYLIYTSKGTYASC